MKTQQLSFFLMRTFVASSVGPQTYLPTSITFSHESPRSFKLISNQILQSSESNPKINPNTSTTNNDFVTRPNYYAVLKYICGQQGHRRYNRLNTHFVRFFFTVYILKFQNSQGKIPNIV